MEEILIKNIYIVENLHGINYFLSEVEDKKDELIIVGNDESAKKFLEKLLDNVNYLYVPKEWYKESFNIMRADFTRLSSLKNEIHKKLSHLNISDKCTLNVYSVDINPYKFFLVDYFQKHNAHIFYEDLYGETPISKIKTSLNEKEQLIINHFNEIYNIELEWISNPTYNTVRMINKFNKKKNFQLLNWEDINKRLNIVTSTQEQEQKKILIIDDAFDKDEINIKETTIKLNQLFSLFKDKQYSVYIKEHYRSSFSINDFYPIKDVTFIDKYLPIELFVPTFNNHIVLSFSSSALKHFNIDTIKCFYITNFITFTQDIYLENRIKVSKKVSDDQISFLNTYKELKDIL